ncbi:MAG: ABC transporter ATP-binding protein [Pseudomonadota bacterium]
MSSNAPASHELAPDLAIEASGLGKSYRIYKRPEDRLLQAIFRGKQRFTPFQALHGVDLSIKRGEAIGVMGRNGSGKSTLLQLLAGTVTPTEGWFKTHGRLAALLELGAGFNPEFTGQENVYLNAAVLGLSQQEIDAKYPEIVEFSEIGDFLDRPVKTYSTGMYMRLAFAVAIAVEPEILIVDEALSVGDEAFQRKCFAYLHRLLENGGTLLFVSHAANSVTELCNRAILLHGGELVLDDTPKRVVQYYQRLLYDRATDTNALIAEIRRHAQAPAASPSAAAALDQQSATMESPGSASGKTLVDAQPDDEAEPYFDPNCVSATTNAYEPNGGRISDPHITTTDGRRVNVISRGQRYQYRFRVEFDRAHEGVHFGMFIRTKTGVDLGGSASSAPHAEKLSVQPGQIVDVVFEFDSRLMPGTYFLNAGCSAMVDGSRDSVHRILDAVMFRVMPELNLAADGLIDFSISAVHHAPGPTVEQDA